jgi:hypothetical protein
MSDRFLEQRIDIKFYVKYGRRWNMMLLMRIRKQTAKFITETADIPTPKASSHIEITDKENAHHFLRLQL